MARPWYAHWLEPYDRKTSGLSMIQHGAYRLLMDEYYKTAAPLPANAEQLYRICRALDDAERAAIDFIVSKYFILEGDRYVNKRADEEIAKAEELGEKRRKAAKSRHGQGDANASANAEQKHTPSPSPSPLPLQDTSSLRSDVAAPPSAAPRSKSTKCQLPSDFPKKQDLEWAERHWLSKGRGDLCAMIDDEIAKFRDHHVSQQKRSADWPASWRTWVRNAMNFTKVNRNERSSKPTATDQHLAGIASIIDDIHAGRA